MLFLLNDVVFDLDEACPVTPADARRFEKLGFDYVLELGCELFAEDPMLHVNDPGRARRFRTGAGRRAVVSPSLGPWGGRHNRVKQSGGFADFSGRRLSPAAVITRSRCAVRSGPDNASAGLSLPWF